MNIIRSSNLQFVPASHEDAKNPGSFKKVLFGKDDLLDGRIAMVNWAKLPRRKSFRAHFHEDMEEVFIIMSGKVEITVEQESATLEKGDAIVIPIHAVHTMKAVGEEDTEYIAMGISLGKGGKTVVTQ